MRPSRVKAKLKRGEPALITCCHFIDPSVYELVSLLGFDGIWLDLEHHSTSDETASNLMRAARVGASDVIARPAKGEFMRMIMVKQGMEQIQQRYAPLGFTFDNRLAAEAARLLENQS